MPSPNRTSLPPRLDVGDLDVLLRAADWLVGLAVIIVLATGALVLAGL